MFRSYPWLAQQPWRYVLLAALLPLSAVVLDAGQPSSAESLWKKLEPFAQPPEEFAGKFGAYRSPLKFNDGSMVKTPADWTRRRGEIAKTWQQRLGAWPPLVERPMLKKLAKVERDGMMVEEAEHFPHYSFDSNRGYPAPVQRTALEGYGPCAIHRRSWAFMDGLLWPQLKYERQPSLFG